MIAEIERCFKHPLGPQVNPSELRNRCFTVDPRAIGFVTPHAGYRYSGAIAAHAYARLAASGAPRTVIIIGPNHSGLGSPVAVMDRGRWITPLGEVEIDSEVAMKLAKLSSFLDIDSRAFEFEHSIEVQLPFIQYLYEECLPRIVPIAVGLQHGEVVKDLCVAISEILDEYEGTVVIATSDWSHYEPYEVAVSKDRKALSYVEALDFEGLLKYYEESNLTACGIAAVAIAMCVARKRGCEKGKVLAYATSGDVTGDKTSVVGYAAIEFRKE